MFFFGGINHRGQVIGVSSTSDSASHAFLYTDGQMIDLGTLGGSSSDASSINNSGQIVGQSFSILGKYHGHAFLHNDGQMQDLNSLIAPNSGWILREATGVNDAGQIVGLAHSTGRSFVLSY